MLSEFITPFRSPRMVLAALFLAAALSPTPASAQFGDFSRAFKKVLKAPKVFDTKPRSSRGSSGSSGGSSESSPGGDSTESGSTSKEVKKEIDRLEKARLLRNAVATYEEALDEARSQQIERQRNVEAAVTDFISCLKGLHNLPSRDGVKWICEVDSTDKASKGSEINQVTEGEIIREVEEAYRRAHLTDFERLAGELWTRERLMVRIVDRSRQELPPYFKGVGAKGPDMAELKKVFAKVALEVYSRSLEISEVIGVSNSFDRFIRTVYENGGEAGTGLGMQGSMQGVDGRFERVATAALASIPREKFIRERVSDGDNESDAQASSDPLGLERQFRYRFRARRVYYECLSASYPDLVHSSGGAGKAIEASHTEQKKSAGGDAMATGSVESSMQDVAWTRATAFVQGKCRSSIDKVAKLTMERKIKPESARWTGGFTAASPGQAGTDGASDQGRLVPMTGDKDQQGRP
ncbi:MAG: hypothetical protein ACKVP4_13825 [Hyphomicrobium sp.]